jgi:hypothetical protein
MSSFGFKNLVSRSMCWAKTQSCSETELSERQLKEKSHAHAVLGKSKKGFMVKTSLQRQQPQLLRLLSSWMMMGHSSLLQEKREWESCQAAAEIMVKSELSNKILKNQLYPDTFFKAVMAQSFWCQ